ncbi:hypothetical protein EON65_13400 [archaeon]|nr:MAG: hypothetical protein EON65_13400 [archaeon]
MPQESLQALAPYATSILKVLSKFAQSDAVNLGISSSQLATINEELNGVILRVVSPYWWQAMTKLLGVYFFLLDDEGEFVANNLYFSCKPFTPIPGEVFRSNLMKLCMPDAQSPLKILTPKRLAHMYREKYGRPVHVDCKNDDWTDVLVGQDGIIVYHQKSVISSNLHDKIICAAGKLTYPVYSQPVDAPKFTRHLCLQLNQLVGILSRSECPLSMEALDVAYYQNSTGMQLQPIVTQTSLLSYVEGVSVEVRIPTLVYAYHGMPIAIEPAADRSLTDLEGATEIPSCRYNPPTAVHKEPENNPVDDMLCWCNAIGNSQMNLSTKVLDDLKLMRAQYTEQQLQALQHLVSLTKPGEYISAAQLNDTMRALTGKGLKDVLGSSQDQKWWIRATTIPGVQFYFKEGDMHKSLNTMLTYTPETPKAVGTASSTVGLVSTTDSNPGKNEAAAMKFLGTELVEDDSSDFLSRPKAAPIISRSSSTSSSRDRVLARHTPAVIVTQAVDKAMIISGDTRLKRRLEDDPDQEDNKRARANIFMIAEYSGNSASSTPPASMPVENAQQPSSYNVASYVQLLKPSDSAAHRIELVQNIQKNLDLMTNVTDESLADILEAIGDYFGKKKQFEQANPRAPAADDTSVVHFVYEVTRHLKKVTGSLTEHTTSKLFMSIRKLPQPSCGKILEGLKVRLECSKSGPVFDPEAICDCFYHIKVFLYSPELKQTILLLGGKLQQWHSVCAEDKLTSLQYAKILLAFKEIPYVDEAISNLLTSINDLMGLPADLEDALADYRQWGSGAHISCGSTSLVELKYIGKGIIKMMNGAMQSSNNLMNQKFAATFRTYDPVLTDPLSTICAYMAVKLSALMRKEPDNKAVSADEDLTVYILQILRGQNSEDIRLRLLMDNLVQYARLLPVSSLKEKFCETTVIFIAHMENFSSDHRVVETLLVFFESILAQYRTLPIGESCATFDDKYLARSTKYLFSPPYMRNALRNLSSSSRIVMRFIVQLQPWLDDYPAARAGRGEKRWDLDDIGQAYLGFRRMREMPRLFEPVTNDTSAIASYQQAITFVNNFQRYALSTMSIPFGQYLVSGRFLKCISRCLMNLSESDEVFAFIVRELVDMLSRSEEELTTVNLLPLDAVADLMYVLGEKRGWTDVAGVVILSSLFNLTENISPQEVKTTVNIAQSDLSHYITMLTSLRGVVVVNQVVLNWFDMLLHFIFSAQVWDAHSTIMSFDQLFHSVSNICAGVSVLLQSHSRVATTCLQQLDLLFVKLSTKTTERNPYDLVMTSPLLALIQMSLWRVYVQRLSINSAAPCNGFFQFVSVSCAALIDTSIQTSSVTEWGHLISAGQVLADTLLLMSSKPEVAETLAGALLHILRIVFNYTGSVAEHAIDLAKDVLESSQAQISQLEQQPAENSTVDKQAILSALIDYAEEARIQSVIIGEEPGNREKPRRDVYILASYVLKCLADMCHHCNKPENASMPLQLQQVVILCLTLVLAYVDELQVTQLHQVLFFCRRFTKLQVYHSVALRRPVLYVLEACIRHAVTFLETSFWSLQNGLKAGEYQERGIVWSDRRVRREDAGRMRDFLRLVNEDTLALYFECMTIMGMIGKNMESKLLHEKKSLLMVHEHFFNGIIALPYRAFCVQFDFLDTLFGVPTITVTSKQEVFIHWKEVQDHAVRYLLRHLGSVEAVHHVVLHGVPCRLAWPVSSAAVRHRMQSLPATWQGAHRAECAQGEIYATCGGGDAIDSEGKVWFCVDIVPLTRCLPASLPRVCGWDDGKQLTKQLNVQYASLLVDTVCEAKPKALLRSVERLVDKFLAVLGLLDC